MLNSPFQVVYVGVGSYAGGRKIGPAKFPHWDLFTLREGTADMRIANDSIRLVAGDAVLIPPDHRFEGVAGSSGAGLWVVHFRATPAKVIAAGLHGKGKPERVSGAMSGDFEIRVANQLLELWHKGEGRQIPAADCLAGYLLAAVAERSRNPETPSGRHRQFELALEESCSELHSMVSVSQLAQRSGLSCSHFRTEFRRLFTRSPSAILRERRLREAARLLRETRLPVKQIAVQAGYGEVSAFHRAFHRHFGKTPARYRQGFHLAV